MQRIEINMNIIKEIICDYTYNKLTQRELVKKYRLGRGTIRRIFNELDIPFRSNHYRPNSRKRTFICSYCGNKLEDYLGNRGKYNIVFCNVKCKGNYMTMNLIGEKSPNWRGGKGTIPEEINWKKIKNDTLKLYNYKCQECSTSENLNVHHKLPRYIIANMFGRTEMRYARKYITNDLIVYCTSCHSKHKNDYKIILRGVTTIISGTLFYNKKSSWDSLNYTEMYRNN